MSNSCVIVAREGRVERWRDIDMPLHPSIHSVQHLSSSRRVCVVCVHERELKRPEIRKSEMKRFDSFSAVNLSCPGFSLL